ncbi:hypothetical protein ACFQ1T_06085 [Methylophilus glucosoxydans]|uniref:EAL domain-containing protein n=1 Tax=Methylophilus glucosoxydans TaxID=752553 RepID=A0ABW3GJT6_9PROT
MSEPLTTRDSDSVDGEIRTGSCSVVVTIAEGIESDIAAIGLRELGCKIGQGHYFADPMDEVETLRWLEEWNKNLAS